ncbi:MAG: Planctomycete cytochrome [Planctomycetaceae bacterium]|nr:Planctomycete cytochrome [Planctomycetaceae bacterium]
MTVATCLAAQWGYAVKDFTPADFAWLNECEISLELSSRRLWMCRSGLREGYRLANLKEKGMNRIIPSLCTFLALFLCQMPASGRAADGQRDLASETLAIFSAKCATCHGPNLVKPEGRFGYILDLTRIAGNREMIVPSFPGESELWELVRRDEMPPEESPTGALSAAEKEVIRAWIAAGTPAPFLAPMVPMTPDRSLASQLPAIEKSKDSHSCNPRVNRIWGGFRHSRRAFRRPVKS